MKALLLLVALTLVGCSVNTSSNIDFDASDLKYVSDPSTGLCFALIASRKSFSTDATGLGMTEVPCNKIK